MTTPTLTYAEVEERVLEADRAGTEASQELLDAVVHYIGDHYGLTPRLHAALHRHSKFASVREGIRAALARREADLPDSIPHAFAEFVDDVQVGQRFVDCCVRNARWALDRRSFFEVYGALSSTCEAALGGGAYTCLLLDRVIAELSTYEPFVKHPVGAQLRLFFRRVRFMALLGTERPLELVLPGEDLRWVDCLKDAIGYRMELLGLSDDERTRLVNAWGAIDWDGTLGVEDVFECEVARPAIEERPWDELAALVLTTSLHRLTVGEQENKTVTRLFARPVSLDARIALADSLVAFATSQRALGKDAKAVVIAAIQPHLDDRKLPHALAKALAPAAPSRGKGAKLGARAAG